MTIEPGRGGGWHAWGWRWQRTAAVMRVETVGLLRDRPTLALVVLVPAVQILLFGATVNLNPRELTLLVAHPPAVDAAPVTRSANRSGYFRSPVAEGPANSGRQAILEGRSQLAVEWNVAAPPRILVDASDPAAVRPAALALSGELQREAVKSLASAAGMGAAGQLLIRSTPSIEWLYNPTASTTWSITPGLIGVVVMITMLLLGALTLVREREQGHWESLLATAVDGVDVLIGKLLPYVLVGVLQAGIVVGCAHLFFNVPLNGSLAALFIAAALLALTHLLLGFALSAIAITQLQAIQSAVFFYLPSMLLSGFMFPFEGMPHWAQMIGECIPLTHFVRVARGVLLRGAEAGWVAQEMWPVAAFATLAAAVALTAYRRHLV